MKSIRSIFVCIAALSLISCVRTAYNLTIELDSPTVPILAGKSSNELVGVRIVEKDGANYKINGASLSLEGTTDIADIRRVALRVGDDCYEGKLGKRVWIPLNLDCSGPCFEMVLELSIKDTVELKNRIALSKLVLYTDRGRVESEAWSKEYRVGVALRQSGDDGSQAYRIPGLTTSKAGTLIALYDKRIEGYRDLQGNIDLCIQRSTDGGRTWGAMQTVLDMGEYGGLPQKFNGVSDGCILSDDNSGALYLFGLWMHGVMDPESGEWIEGLDENSQEWNHQWASRGSQSGYGLKQSSQMIVSKSVDDGLTWSEPVNITRQVKQEEWWLMAPAPGHGITLDDGTLLIPAEGRTQTGLQFGTIIYSTNGGETWEAGNPAYYNANEGMAVQLSDGSVMLNIRERSNGGRMEGNGRAVTVTHDLGKTWLEHPSSRNALVEPACMASLHKHKGVLLFTNPNSKTSRVCMTLKCSYDDGMTWPEDKWLLLDELRGNGYSCITSIDDKTIGVLYEGSGADMVFQQIDISHLLKNRD